MKPNRLNSISMSVFYIAVIALLMLGVCTPSTLAADFDNVATNYNEETRTYTITNLFGLGADIANITLVTPLEVLVMRGEERKVGEIEIDLFDSYEEVFGDIELFEVDKGMQRLNENRNIKYKYKNLEDTKSIPIYREDCSEEILGNGTTQTNCYRVLDHYEDKEVFEWKAFNQNTELEAGKITLGLFAEVKANDKIDWIPETFGVPLSNFAVWTESLDVNNSFWFSFESNESAVLEDVTGNGNNGTVFLCNETNGLIDDAYHFNGAATSWVNVSHELFNEPKQSFSVWINPDVASGTGEDLIWGAGLAAGLPGEYGYYLERENSGKMSVQMGVENNYWLSDVLGTNWTVGQWIHIVVTMDSTGDTRIYFNGVLAGTDSDAWTPVQKASMSIGTRQGFARDFGGELDEFGGWNRILSPAEVVQLYNEGNGINPEVVEQPTITLNLNYPVNNTNSSNNTITFKAALNSTLVYNLTNATIFIKYQNGTNYYNETNDLSGQENSTLFNVGMVRNNFSWSVKGCAGNSSTVLCKYTDDNYTINIVDATTVNQYYKTPTTEQSFERYSINISTFGDIEINNADLILNGTTYPAGITNLGITNQNISIAEVNLIIPQISATQDFILYWSVNLTNGEVYNSIPQNQTINDLGSISIVTGDCQAGFYPAINYTFRDEGNLSAIRPDLNYNFKYGIADNTAFSIFGNETNVTSLQLCINSSLTDLELGYGEIDYEEEGFVRRRFYMFEGQELTNSTGVLYELYDLHNSQSTSFSISVEDRFLNPLVSKYVATLRWYPQFDEYRIVEMVLTDEEGESVVKVRVEDIDYRFAVYHQNGSLIKLEEPARMACLVDPCSFSIAVDLEGTDLFSILDIQASLVYDEANTRFVYTWNDPSQDTQAMRLIVTRDLGFQEETICNVSTSSFTGVLLCALDVNKTGLYNARVFRTASPTIAITSLIKEIRTVMNNAIGVFISAMVALTMALIGTVSPIAAIILMILGLIPAVIFGAITFTMFMAIGLLGGIIIHILKKT